MLEFRDNSVYHLGWLRIILNIDLTVTNSAILKVNKNSRNQIERFIACQSTSIFCIGTFLHAMFNKTTVSKTNQSPVDLDQKKEILVVARKYNFSSHQKNSNQPQQFFLVPARILFSRGNQKNVFLVQINRAQHTLTLICTHTLLASKK